MLHPGDLQGAVTLQAKRHQKCCSPVRTSSVCYQAGESGQWALKMRWIEHSQALRGSREKEIIADLVKMIIVVWKMVQ